MGRTIHDPAPKRGKKVTFTHSKNVSVSVNSDDTKSDELELTPSSDSSESAHSDMEDNSG